MSRTEAEKKAQQKYELKAMKQISLKLNRNTDADIIAKLDSVDNVRGYIISLIREDIEIDNLQIDNISEEEMW
jgi:hypothetical protein